MNKNLKIVAIIIGVIASLFAIYRGYTYYKDRQLAAKAKADEVQAAADDDAAVDTITTITVDDVADGNVIANDAAATDLKDDRV